MKLQVGVKVLIKNEDGAYLFIQRAQKMGDESEPHWDMPGGRINEDEPLHTALAREIMEETGLQLDDEPRLVNAQDIFVQKADLHVVRLTYTAVGSGEVVMSDEHQHGQWLSLDDARKLNLDPYLRDTLPLIV